MWWLAVSAVAGTRLDPVDIRPWGGPVLVQFVPDETPCRPDPELHQPAGWLLNIRSITGPDGREIGVFNQWDERGFVLRGMPLDTIDLDLAARAMLDRPGRYRVVVRGPCGMPDAFVEIDIPAPPPPDVLAERLRDAAAAAEGAAWRWFATAAFVPAAEELALQGNDFAASVIRQGTTIEAAAARVRLTMATVGKAPYMPCPVTAPSDPHGPRLPEPLAADLDRLGLDAAGVVLGAADRLIRPDVDDGFVRELFHRALDPASAPRVPASDVELLITLWAMGADPTFEPEDPEGVRARGTAAGGLLATLALDARFVEVDGVTIPATKSGRMVALRLLIADPDPAALPAVLAMVRADDGWKTPPRRIDLHTRMMEEVRSHDIPASVCRAAVHAVEAAGTGRLELARVLAERATTGESPQEAIGALGQLLTHDGPCGLRSAAALSEFVEAHAAQVAAGHAWSCSELPD